MAFDGEHRDDNGDDPCDCPLCQFFRGELPPEKAIAWATAQLGGLIVENQQLRSENEELRSTSRVWEATVVLMMRRLGHPNEYRFTESDVLTALAELRTKIAFVVKREGAALVYKTGRR